MALPDPSYVTEENVAAPMVASPIGTGVFWRRPFWTPVYSSAGDGYGTHYPRRFRLVYLPGQLNTARANALFAEWNIAKAGAGTVTFTAPWTPNAYTVRFIDDEITFDVASLVAFGCELLVEETIA